MERTIGTKEGMEPFISWQRITKERNSPYYRASPNLLALRDYLFSTWGGTSLGLYHVRPIRNGVAPSSHAFGAALDYKYPEGKKTAVINFVIAHHKVLGIQAIHDYAGGRIWRADRNAWRKSTISGMGEAWATYLHLETHPYGWDNATPISDRLPATQNDSRKDDIEMIALDYKPNTDDWTAMLWNGTHLSWLQGHADAVLVAQGVKRSTVNDAQLDHFIRSSVTTTAAPPTLPTKLKELWNRNAIKSA